MAILPKITLIYDRYKRASSKRKSSVEVRITYNRKQKYISTGIEVYPKEWKKDAVIGRTDAKQLNQQLQQFLIDIRCVLMKMEEEGSVDIFAVPEKLKELRNGAITLYDFMEQRMSVRIYGKSKDSQVRYKRFLRLFKEYGKIKNFEDITDNSIIGYDKYLTSKGMKPCSKWSNYHRFLNSFIIDAMEVGLLKRNPYKWINIDRGKENGLSRYLTLEEFNRIKRVKLPTECLEKVRDVFVFQTYTCLSYADLAEFNADAIIDIKGMKVYTGSREKTDKRFTVPLLPTAIEILKKYNNVLPVISNVKYNQYLKVVAQAAGIEKPISTHWARHTGATILLNAGIPMQVVSKICGHSSTRITESTYAKLLDETVVEAVKKLKNKQK